MNGTGQLYDLLDNVNDLIQSVAPDGAMLYVNRTWRETLGYSPAEIAGLNVLDVIHPDCRAQCMELFGRVMCGETVNAICYQGGTADCC
jgi:adenylate cyclase